MEDRDNKTIICSVLFLDIVEYSKKAVSGQISLKEGFNVFLATALDGIPVTDRIILDTGDGAAISFLGDIEDALKVGLSMRHSLVTAGACMDPPLLVRLGINLGPVRLVKDLNNQPNIVGDGINVAQRVMGFADISQLLVSRSYYDAVSRISLEYAGMFHDLGSRTDKHVREHEVYAIGYPGEFTTVQKGSSVQAKLNQAVAGLQQGIVKLGSSAIGSFQKATAKQRMLYVGLPVLALLLLGAGLAVMKRGIVAPDKQMLVQDSPDAEAAPALTVGEVMLKKPKVDTTKVSKPVREVAKVDAAKKTVEPSIATVRTLEETRGSAVVISLVVLPWGEIYLDGKKQGYSPPLMKLQVAPGRHEIEIRNSDFSVYKQTIQAKVGEEIKVSHKFSN